MRPREVNGLTKAPQHVRSKRWGASSSSRGAGTGCSLAPTARDRTQQSLPTGQRETGAQGWRRKFENQGWNSPWRFPHSDPSRGPWGCGGWGHRGASPVAGPLSSGSSTVSPERGSWGERLSPSAAQLLICEMLPVAGTPGPQWGPEGQQHEDTLWDGNAAPVGSPPYAVVLQPVAGRGPSLCPECPSWRGTCWLTRQGCGASEGWIWFSPRCPHLALPASAALPQGRRCHQTSGWGGTLSTGRGPVHNLTLAPGCSQSAPGHPQDVVFPGHLHWSPPPSTNLHLPGKFQHCTPLVSGPYTLEGEAGAELPCLPLLSPGSLPGPLPHPHPSPSPSSLLPRLSSWGAVAGWERAPQPTHPPGHSSAEKRQENSPHTHSSWNSVVLESPPSLFQEKWVLPSFSLSLWGFGKKKKEEKQLRMSSPVCLPLSGVRRVPPHKPPPRHPSSHSRSHSFLLQMCVTNNGHKTKAFCSDRRFPSGPQPPHRGDSNRVSLCSLCLVLCRAGPWTRASPGGSLDGEATPAGSLARAADVGHAACGEGKSGRIMRSFPRTALNSATTGKGETYMKVSCPLWGSHMVDSWQTVHMVINKVAATLEGPCSHLPRATLASLGQDTHRDP